MPLAPGGRIGGYEVTALIGEGGMGQVYRATDTKLIRSVAIKVLPDSLAADPERIARFEREARTLAALNHPHIAQIHGLEESGGLKALVMEFVDGPTLADRLSHGPIAVDEAIGIAKQIAEALEAAHEQGIIHRDLKPANIKVRPDGMVKVLDFGLAKAMDHASGTGLPAPGLSLSPTITTPAMTMRGVILGTAAYMSPEQARGKVVDKRTDIWAFGCVLYEMLTGRRAFEAEDVSLTLAEVMKSDPDWKALPGLPPLIETFLRQCLKKDPRQRISDIHDVRLALEGAFEAAVASLPAVPATVPTRRGWLAAAVGVAMLTVAGITAVGMYLWSRPVPAALMRFTISANQFVPSVNYVDLAVSPDGRRIAYTSVEDATAHLYVREMSGLEALEIKGVTEPRNPFFSSDGAWIGFFEGETLKKVAPTGGPAAVICKFNGIPRGANWLGETIVFATSDPTTGLLKVSAQGGTPEALTRPAKGDDVFPEFLPGGRMIVFSSLEASAPGASGQSATQIEALDTTTGARKVLLQGGTNPRYALSGHLVYGYSGSLRAVPFDASRLEIGGDSLPVVERVLMKPGGATNFAMTAEGSLVYVSGDAASDARVLVWVDRQGKEEVIAGAPIRGYIYPRISPDGRQVALDIRDQTSDIWTWDIERRGLTKLTLDAGLNRGVAWSPDGTRLAFSAERAGKETLFWQAYDGTGKPEPLTQSNSRPQVPYSFSPDGRLLFGEPGAPPFDLYAIDTAGANRTIESLLTASSSELNGEVSPNGRWLAYQSNESGRDEVYVRSFPDVAGLRRQISLEGGTRPVWARSGRELFYLAAGQGRLMSVPVETEGVFRAGGAQRLFEGPYFRLLTGRTYDVSPDGKRFLMIRNAPGATPLPPQMVVVLNWQEELKRLVPVR